MVVKQPKDEYTMNLRSPYQNNQLEPLLSMVMLLITLEKYLRD